MWADVGQGARRRNTWFALEGALLGSPLRGWSVRERLTWRDLPPTATQNVSVYFAVTKKCHKLAQFANPLKWKTHWRRSRNN